MKAKVMVEREVNIITLKVNAKVRYWDDAEINGISDELGELTPFKNGENWCPVIEIDTGIIKDWPKETKANIHFKVCDCGSYYLLDENNEVVGMIEDDYVPSILCPKEDGYGDYIIMDIDENGQIQNWEPNIDDFFKED